MRQRKGVPPLTEDPLENVARRGTAGGVSRRISRKSRRGNKWGEAGIGFCSCVAIRVGSPNCGYGPPKIKVVFRLEDGDRAVVDGHIQERERPRVRRQRFALRGAQLPRHLVPYLRWSGGRVESGDVGAIIRSESAVDAADLQHLLVISSVGDAGQCGRPFRTELAGGWS